ncbi:MAG: hypothetical protein AAGD92_14795 [Pseudomonadota bacterium]
MTQGDVGILKEAGDEAGSIRSLRIAVAGLGLIGGGVAVKLLKGETSHRLCAALVRDVSKDRGEFFRDVLITDDIASLLATSPDIVIDALPDGAAGRKLIKAALEAGVSVVSANKQGVAGALGEFHRLAEKTGALFYYSASVGGETPMVETIRKYSDHARIQSVSAILNGTVNYILTALAQGKSFAAAVTEAQDAGFAEPDPTADLSGADAVAKISILSFEAFGAEIDILSTAATALSPEMASEIEASGGVWRQVSTVERGVDGDLTAAVRILPIEESHYLHTVDNEENALILKLAAGAGDIVCKGRGAGQAPTVASLFNDVTSIAAVRVKS